MKITVWGASDENGESYLYDKKPERTILYSKAVWIGGSTSLRIKGDMIFPTDKSQQFELKEIDGE